VACLPKRDATGGRCSAFINVEVANGMSLAKLAFLALLASAWLQSAPADQTWKSRQIAEWSETDAKDVLSESPWVKSFAPVIKSASVNESQGRSRRMGRGGGVGMGGVGISLPGRGGMGRRGGMGSPGGGGGYPGRGQNRRNPDSAAPPTLTMRWESAMPVRSAELKVHDSAAPTLDGKHYAIAVYGIPPRLLPGDGKKLAGEFKKKAFLKRDGKKNFKPSSVEVLDRPEGRVVVFLFPNSTEITKADHRVEFDATMGRVEVAQSFFVDEMIWQGKLEL
jgi:hypothetical protein